MAASSSMNSGTVGSRRWDLNPRPAVYETAALPLSYAGEASCAKVLRGGRARVQRGSVYCGVGAIVKQLRWAKATSSSSREAVLGGSSERRWGGSWGAIRRNRRSTPRSVSPRERRYRLQETRSSSVDHVLPC